MLSSFTYYLLFTVYLFLESVAVELFKVWGNPPLGLETGNQCMQRQSGLRHASTHGQVLWGAFCNVQGDMLLYATVRVIIVYTTICVFCV